MIEKKINKIYVFFNDQSKSAIKNKSSHLGFQNYTPSHPLDVE